MIIEQDHPPEYYGSNVMLVIPAESEIGENLIDTEEIRREKEAAFLAQVAHIKEIWGEAGDRATEYMTRIREESAGGNFTIFLVGNLKKDRICPPLIELLRQNEPFNLVMVSPQKLDEMMTLQGCLWKLPQAPAVSISTSSNLSVAVEGEVERVKKKEEILLKHKETERQKRELFPSLYKDEPIFTEIPLPKSCVFFYFTEVPPKCSRPARFSLNRRVVAGIDQLRVNNRSVIILNERDPGPISP